MVTQRGNQHPQSFSIHGQLWSRGRSFQWGVVLANLEKCLNLPFQVWSIQLSSYLKCLSELKGLEWILSADKAAVQIRVIFWRWRFGPLGLGMGGWFNSRDNFSISGVNPFPRRPQHTDERGRQQQETVVRDITNLYFMELALWWFSAVNEKHFCSVYPPVPLC